MMSTPTTPQPPGPHLVKARTHIRSAINEIEAAIDAFDAAGVPHHSIDHLRVIRGEATVFVRRLNDFRRSIGAIGMQIPPPEPEPPDGGEFN